MSLFGDKSAVSPVMAALVLVIVAVVGALGVGVIMNSFSTQTADEVSAGQSADASKMELTIAGSTTVTPVVEEAAKEFMKNNPGVKFDIQPVGSGAGIVSTGEGLVDIGMASKFLDVDDKEKYPNIRTITVGGSGVVVITNGLNYNFTYEAIKTIYEDEDGKVSINDTNSDGVITSSEVDTTGTDVTVFQRSDESGTEETFAKWLGLGKQLPSTCGAKGEEGNPGVLNAVDSTQNSIGFVDYGFAEKATTAKVVNVSASGDSGPFYEPTSDNIKKELQKVFGGDKTDGPYVAKLVRPLNLLTNGEPNSIAQKFINYMNSPISAKFFHDCGYFHITELK